MRGERVEEVQPRPLMRRRLYVMQSDVERLGPTDGFFSRRSETESPNWCRKAQKALWESSKRAPEWRK